MSSNRLAQVGDIIMSKKFVNGSRDLSGRSKIISISNDHQPFIIQRSMTKEEITAYILKNGHYPQNESIEEDFSAPDMTRANARYLVISAKMAGGGQDGCQKVEDEWQVVAQRLKPNDQYDPKGEIITFFMTGNFQGTVYADDIAFVGHKQKVINFI